MQTKRALAAGLGVSLGLFALLAFDVKHGGVAKHFDFRVESWVLAHTGDGSRRFALDWMSLPGSRAVVAVGAMVGAGLLAWRRRWRRVVVLAGATGMQVVVVTVLKDLLAVPRPSLTILSFGFPSGHATSAMVFWGLAAAIVAPMVPAGRGPLVWVAALALIAVTCAGRVIGDVHWLSDVAGGVLLGTVFVCAGRLVMSYGAPVTRPAGEPNSHH